MIHIESVKQWEAETEYFQAEIKRLRAALEEVRSGEWTTMMELRAIADRALAETR